MATQKTITINDQPVVYRITGQGKPVMLVHGFGEDGTIWEQQVAALENNYLVMVPDLPGSGLSALTDDVSMEAMAEMLKTILDDAAVDTCTMIGHSMGGYITLAFAEKYPDRLNGFGLFHSTAYADNEEKKTTRRRGIEFIREHGAAPFLEQAIPNLFSEETKKNNPALVKEIIDRFTNFPAQSLVSYYEAMIQRPDRTHVLKNFPQPVLFIIGKHDNAVPPEQSLEQSCLPLAAHVHILEHSGHLGMLEEEPASTGFVEKFLQFL